MERPGKSYTTNINDYIALYRGLCLDIARINHAHRAAIAGIGLIIGTSLPTFRYCRRSDCSQCF